MRLIDISTPKHPNTFTMVDDEDFDWVNQWKWHGKAGQWGIYAGRHAGIRGGKRESMHMHRFIFGPTKGSALVDHIDGNPLNNQKSNLRACSHKGNAQNRKPMRTKKTSAYKGVCFQARERRFIARIYVNGFAIGLGYHKLEADAAAAYNEAAKKYYGEFAWLNKIKENHNET